MGHLVSRTTQKGTSNQWRSHAWVALDWLLQHLALGHWVKSVLTSKNSSCPCFLAELPSNMHQGIHQRTVHLHGSHVLLKSKDLTWWKFHTRAKSNNASSNKRPFKHKKMWSTHCPFARARTSESVCIFVITQLAMLTMPKHREKYPTIISKQMKKTGCLIPCALALSFRF